MLGIAPGSEPALINPVPPTPRPSHTPPTEFKNLHPTITNRQAMHDSFREDVLAGLALPNKSIPAKYLYNARGSKIFEDICDVAEYYPTRTEQIILLENAASIAQAIGPDAALIEPGSGSGEKAIDLLATLDAPHAFVPIEISRSALEASAQLIAQRFPALEVFPVCADFTLDLDTGIPCSNRVVFFPGSTIGNLTPQQRLELLRSFAKLANAGREQGSEPGRVLIGFDLVKDEQVLLDAYNDSAGVTAAFNLNLLSRINDELDGTFDLSAFEHDAPWNESQHRIEMHLISTADQRIHVAGQAFEFTKGERIHTENSHKFTPESFADQAAEAGLCLVEQWTDPKEWFCVGLYQTACN